MTLLSSTSATWQQLFGLDRILFGFLLLSSSSVFQSGFSSGRTFFKSPNNAKPYRCTKLRHGAKFAACFAVELFALYYIAVRVFLKYLYLRLSIFLGELKLWLRKVSTMSMKACFQSQRRLTFRSSC